MPISHCFGIAGDEYFEKGFDIFINRHSVPDRVLAHEHRFIEIGYVLSGSILQRMEDNETVFNKGDFYIINYNVMHDLVRNSEEMPFLQNTIFKPALIDHYLYNCTDFCEITEHYLINSQFIPDKKALSHYKFSDKNGEILNTLNKLMDEYTNRKHGFMEMLRSYVIQIIIASMRMFNEEIENLPGNGTDDKQINKVITYFKNNYSNTIALQTMAEIAYMNPEYFCRKFKSKTGLTPTQFLQKIRIQEACRLLLNTNNKIPDIAEQVGYISIKYFNTLFKSLCKLSPTQYREAYQNSIKKKREYSE